GTSPSPSPSPSPRRVATLGASCSLAALARDAARAAPQGSDRDLGEISLSVESDTIVFGVAADLVSTIAFLIGDCAARAGGSDGVRLKLRQGPGGAASLRVGPGRLLGEGAAKSAAPQEEPPVAARRGILSAHGGGLSAFDYRDGARVYWIALPPGETMSGALAKAGVAETASRTAVSAEGARTRAPDVASGPQAEAAPAAMRPPAEDATSTPSAAAPPARDAAASTMRRKPSFVASKRGDFERRRQEKLEAAKARRAARTSCGGCA
ncbi:MAG: hypothetical protein AAFW46_10670, partial [Pseudomonadota bacterium]